MRIEGKSISSKAYFQPIGSFTVHWLKKVLKWFGIFLLAVIILFLGWRFGIPVYFHMVSEPLVYLDVGQGGFNFPAKEIYWANGSVLTSSKGWLGVLDFRQRKTDPANVHALVQAIEAIDPQKLTEREGFGGSECFALDAPDVKYTSVRTGSQFTIPGSKSGCYDEINDIENLLNEIHREQ